MCQKCFLGHFETLKFFQALWALRIFYTLQTICSTSSTAGSCDFEHKAWVACALLRVQADDQMIVPWCIVQLLWIMFRYMSWSTSAYYTFIKGHAFLLSLALAIRYVSCLRSQLIFALRKGCKLEIFRYNIKAFCFKKILGYVTLGWLELTALHSWLPCVSLWHVHGTPLGGTDQSCNSNPSGMLGSKTLEHWFTPI